MGIGNGQRSGPADVAVYLHPADAALAAKPRSNSTDSSLLPYLPYLRCQPATWAGALWGAA